MDGAGRSHNPLGSLNPSRADLILGTKKPQQKIPAHYQKFLQTQWEATSNIKTHSGTDLNKFTSLVLEKIVNKIKTLPPVKALSNSIQQRKGEHAALLNLVRTKAKSLGMDSQIMDKQEARKVMERALPGSSIVWESNGELFGAHRGTRSIEVLNLSKASFQELKTFNNRMTDGAYHARQIRSGQLTTYKDIYHLGIENLHQAEVILESAPPATFLIWKDSQDRITISFSRIPLHEGHQPVVHVPVPQEGDLNTYMRSIATSLQLEAGKITIPHLREEQVRNAERYLT